MCRTSGRAALYEAVLWPNGSDTADLVADSDEEVLTEEEPSDTEAGAAANEHNGKGAALQAA